MKYLWKDCNYTTFPVVPVAWSSLVFFKLNVAKYTSYGARGHNHLNVFLNFVYFSVLLNTKRMNTENVLHHFPFWFLEDIVYKGSPWKLSILDQCLLTSRYRKIFLILPKKSGTLCEHHLKTPPVPSQTKLKKVLTSLFSIFQ